MEGRRNIVSSSPPPSPSREPQAHNPSAQPPGPLGGKRGACARSVFGRPPPQKLRFSYLKLISAFRRSFSCLRAGEALRARASRDAQRDARNHLTGGSFECALEHTIAQQWPVEKVRNAA